MKKKLLILCLTLSVFQLAGCQGNVNMPAEADETESSSSDTIISERPATDSEASTAENLPDTTQTSISLCNLDNILQDDLDHDGTDEDILFNITVDDLCNTTPTLNINESDFSPIFEKNQIYFSDNLNPEFCTIDLNTSDNSRELCLIDLGVGEFASSYIFHYENSELTYIGSFPGRPMNDDCIIPGDGTVSVPVQISLLETANTTGKWKLNSNGQLEKIKEDWYPIADIDWNTGKAAIHDILTPVTVYQENSKSSKTLTLTKDDGPFSFDATDNINWVRISNTKGQEYYLYMKDFSTIESGTAELTATDVFSNIWLAG